MAGYEWFASFYDELMEDAHYGERCDYLLGLLERHSHPSGMTLDLACGTGSLTIELKKRGVEVFGIDGSVDMLTHAKQKCVEQGVLIPFAHQQMQELKLTFPIDTCFCTLDSLNHITDKVQLRRTISRVGRYMNEGGLFVFDVNTVYKHQKVLADNAFIIENEQVFCAWQNTLLPDNIVEIDLDFFCENGGKYERYSESFAERAYSDEELRSMLEEAGFTVEAVYGDFTFEPPAPDEQRAVYVAKKIVKGILNG